MSIYERKGKTFANRWPKFYGHCGHQLRVRDGSLVPCPVCKPVERHPPSEDSKL